MGKRREKRVEKVWTSKTIANNRKARYLYHIDETHEAGLVLVGTEVKSLRAGGVSLGDAFAIPKKGELWLMNLHIGPYEQGSRFNHEPRRPRKLLLHRREIERLTVAVSQRGCTLVPLRVHFKNRRVKVDIAICRGKKIYDKRHSIKERDLKRTQEREYRIR